MKSCLVAVLGLFVVSCASAPLTESEKAVRVLRKSDAPPTCKEVGKVFSSGLAAWSDEGRENNLKREVAKVGGDTVTWDKQDENNTIYGTAFKCGGGK